jgi:hypothetical protein
MPQSGDRTRQLSQDGWQQSSGNSYNKRLHGFWLIANTRIRSHVNNINVMFLRLWEQAIQVETEHKFSCKNQVFYRQQPV